MNPTLEVKLIPPVVLRIVLQFPVEIVDFDIDVVQRAVNNLDRRHRVVFLLLCSESSIDRSRSVPCDVPYPTLLLRVRRAHPGETYPDRDNPIFNSDVPVYDVWTERQAIMLTQQALQAAENY